MSLFSVLNITALLLAASFALAIPLQGGRSRSPTSDSLDKAAATTTTTTATLFAIGGIYNGTYNDETADVDIISLSNNTHKTGAPAPKTISRFGSVVVNNTIYVAGGYEIDRFWSYDISANIWTVLPDLPNRASSGVSLVEVNGTLVAILSINSINVGNEVYTYNVAAAERGDSSGPGKWMNASAVPTPSVTTCTVIVNEQVFVLTDENVYRLDGIGQNWTTLNPSSSPFSVVSDTACVLLNDDVVLVTGGGSDGTDPQKVLAYNITSNSWSTSASMTRGRSGHSAVALPGGDSVLVCGGETGDEHRTILDDCEMFDAKSNKWTASPVVLDKQRMNFQLVIAQTPV